MNAPLSTSSDDLSALAWVQEELRRSLEAAHKGLRRFVKDTEALGDSDVDTVDTGVLRTARTQIHQGVGALEMVGERAVAMVLRASEAAVQRFVTKPTKLTGTVVDDLERSSFAVLDYLTRLLAGKPVSTLSLFPQYRAVQEAGGADRVHPADLWVHEWQWHELPRDASATPRSPDEATHGLLEGQLLPLMRARDPRPVAARISDITAALGAGASQPQVATLWQLAAGVFEAQAHGLLGFDVFSKRLASRLLAQFRILERGDTEVSERLAQDLLFFCAQSAAPADPNATPRLDAVRRTFGLASGGPVDYSLSVLGRFDPAVIAQARKRVTAAKDAWSGVAGGEMHRMTGLSEQFALVGESLKRLFPLGDTFALELQQAVAQTQQSGREPPAPLAMEVATSLLYVEAALEDADFDHPEQAVRVQRLADRLAAVRSGHAPEPLESWMEDLYRRVSDRQTMGSVVQELRASLSESEKLIDTYFRNPADRQVLIPVPGQLSAMRGVLSVLGMDHACAALLRMRDEVDGLASTEIDATREAHTSAFDHLASNLGALGFLIDMLSVQPQMAKSLFAFDAATGTLNPVMGRSEVHAPPISHPTADQRLIDQAQALAASATQGDMPVADVARGLERLSQEAQAADQPALAATARKAMEALDHADTPAGEVAARDALADFVSTASDPVGLAAPEPAAADPDRVSRPMSLDFAPSTRSAQLAQDDEMLEIFLEEAREVIGNANAAHAELTQAPEDVSLMTTLRRAFHTLKGSSRMVGLKEFGEAAWVGEQLFNAHLAEQRAAPTSLLDFTSWCLAYFTGWVDEISAKSPITHDVPTVASAAKVAGAPVQPPEAALESAAASHALPADLPTAADLELHAAPEQVPSEPEPIPMLPVEFPAFATAHAAVDPALPEPALPELSFDLDLAGLDAPLAEPHAPDEVVSEHGSLDMSTAELLDPFDVEATQPLPLEEHPAPAPEDRIDLDLAFDLSEPAQESQAAPIEPALHEVVAEEPTPVVPEEEHVKLVGPLRISIPLFNIYLNEADELSRRLTTEVAEWALELHRPIGETPIALAHSLAGSSATVGFSDLSHLARLLEHAQARSQAIGHGTEEEARLFVDTSDEIRRLLHQFAAGFLKEPSSELLARLADHEVTSARRLEAAAAAAEESAAGESIVAEEPAAAAPIVETPERVEPAAEPELVHEPVAFLHQPEPELELGPDTEPAPLSVPAPFVAESGGASPSETHFDPLGLSELKPLGEVPVETTARHAPADHGLVDADEAIDALDAIDADLFPIFDEEAQELLPELTSRLREWARRPADTAHPAACMRTLHTLKGGARLAGAMRLGEMAHRLETRIERLLAQLPVDSADVEALQSHGDALAQTLEALRTGAPADALTVHHAPADAGPSTISPALEVLLETAPPEVPESPLHVEPAAAVPVEPEQVAPSVAAPAVEPAVAASIAPAVALPEIDWSRFASTGAVTAPKPAERAQASQSAVRVRAPLLDRLVNQAGEVSITRSRIESGVGQIKGSLGDLTENLERLRAQLRDIEFHGETQMTSRLEAAKAASQAFDPLEFDRFTRFQELTRMMAESVNDVATVQRTLQRALEVTEDELVAQARMTRDLQDDLLRTRMVEFEGLSDRLYRVVRQAAKETGKSVRLDIVGGSIEVDRGVLDRMTGSFEHLLRNCVTHGIESPDVRTAAGKDPTGTIIVALSQEGNEVGVEFRDDGAGLNLPRIRAKGEALGLLAPGASATDGELANLIFTPGFSTAEQVTELAGRGVGMDVVRSEVNAMGGRVETATAAGQGTSFKLILPLTTAVTQVVMLRCGETQVAVPSTLVEIVRRASQAELDAAYASASYTVGDRAVQFFWLGSLLQISSRPAQDGGARTRPIIVIRSAQQRVALHVDEVLGNQEVVVKHLGPQLSRLPGLAGITLLASGEVALIYNPVALATLYGDAARAATLAALRSPEAQAAAPVLPHAPPVVEAPLVMVVDDSLTVRRVTQRLLQREGYRVVLAKDGLDALERLAEAIPAIVLSDIEMPRMDGFDLVRNMRADSRLRELPVIMITSRIAQKHRDYAAELGVDHYLGKPYSEEDLLALISRYTSRVGATTVH